MAFICSRICIFCRCNVYFCKMWDQENGFHSSNSSTHHRGTDLCLGDGISGRIPDQIPGISSKTLLFLIMSGLATGASWLCYFRALQIGDVNKVVPVDKSSTVLTIILALIFFHEGLRPGKAVAILVITAGIYLMIQKKDTVEEVEKKGSSWFWYACGSAVFASLTSILGKIGINGVESNLGTAIRTTVVLVVAWVMVFVTGKGKEIKNISRKEGMFICCSGLATGASWLCYYHALQLGTCQCSGTGR